MEWGIQWTQTYHPMGTGVDGWWPDGTVVTSLIVQPVDHPRRTEIGVMVARPQPIVDGLLMNAALDQLDSF